jgi:transcriptional regulator with XRE-family HTH domain
MVTPEVTVFGGLLRTWRRRRGHSQLDLSLRAGVSSRHLSFVESGRSRPSREMVLHLCSVLQVPLRESNDLLLAAGFAPAHRETPLTGPALRAANAAIDLILTHQEPYPAVVMDRRWNLVRGNTAAGRFFRKLLGERAATEPANVLRLVFAADGLRPWLANWPEVARSLLDRVRREAVGGVVDDETKRLLEVVAGDVGSTADAWKSFDAASPLVPLCFRKGDLELDFFSTVTTLGTPRDIALQELRVECFFPANDATRERAPSAY